MRVVWSATCMLDLGKEFAIMAVTILANLSSYPSGRDVISNKQTIDGLVAVACGKSKVKVSSAVLKSVALIFHNVVCGYGRIKEQKKKKIRDLTLLNRPAKHKRNIKKYNMYAPSADDDLLIEN